MSFDLAGVHVPRHARAAMADSAGVTSRFALCPFTVLIDTREQLPYEFSGIRTTDGGTMVVRTIHRGLPSGDYSIDGLESRVAVERKSLEDLYGSVTWGRERFEREIVRLNEAVGFSAVVIEATWQEISDPAVNHPDWTNQTDPRAVESTIAAWSLRYHRVHWWACGSRRSAELRAFAILKAAWAVDRKEKKQKARN